MTINDKTKYGQEKTKISRKDFLYWIFVGLLLIVNTILLFLFLDTQYKLNFAGGKFDAALNSISNRNEEIRSYQGDIEAANSRIAVLNSKVNSQNSEIDSQNSEINSLNSKIQSLNSKISSLSTIKITRVDVVNNASNNQYFFIDGRLVAGTRGGGKTYFYIPPGTYNFQSCSDTYISNCGSKNTFTASSSVFTWTIR